jgi:RNA exonuclease 4
VNPGVSIDYSCIKIHGIHKEWLDDAPSVEQVKEHILSHFKNAIFIGHGVLTDLKVMDLGTLTTYIDTTWLDKGNPRKLKDLVRDQLNAAIQTDAHSSVTDARAAMALFKLN